MEKTNKKYDEDYKKTLLSLLKAVNLFLILSVNMALIAKIFTIGNISMVT